MKIHINEDSSNTETEIVINCRQTNEEILKILATLRAFDQKITGIKDGQTFLLDANKILYAESVDKKTFFYAANAVYETPLKLYELEERLSGNYFFRGSKSVVINFNQIKALRPDFGGKMQVTMNNGEVIMASRQYVPAIKEKLGLNRR